MKKSEKTHFALKVQTDKIPKKPLKELFSDKEAVTKIACLETNPNKAKESIKKGKSNFIYSFLKSKSQSIYISHSYNLYQDLLRDKSS